MDVQYLKRAAFFVVSLILSALIVMYVTYHLFNGFENEVETCTVVQSEDRETLSLEAYLFRRETILYTDTDSVVNCLYGNGDKVGSGYAVANVYSGNSTAIRQRIVAIDNKIAVLENSGVGANLIGSDTASLDSQINSLYYLIRTRIEGGDYDYAAHKKDELLTLLNRRQMIVETVSGYEKQIAELESEKERLTSALDQVADTVYAPASGWLYLDVDGYEGQFTADAVDSMTLEDFFRLENADPDDSVFKNENGYAVCKLVTDYTWYIACPVSRDSLKNFVVGNRYTVLFPYSGDTEIAMTLDRTVTTKESDTAVLVFRTSIMPGGFNYLRRQSVEIVEDGFSGYRVPLSAVRMVDGRQGVYVLDGSVVRFRTIVPLLEKDGYFIVAEKDDTDEEQADRLALYDQVIVQGKGLYDGQIIR